MKGRGLLAAVAAAAIVAIAAPAAFGATIRVNDDLVPATCVGAFPTIQAGVNAAAPGDTVLVCRGTYNESVTIDKSIIVQGQVAPPLGCFGTAPTFGPNTHVVVNGTGPFAFFLDADGITLRRFVIQNTSGGPGIWASNAFSGYVISQNLIRNNVFGIYLNSNGATQTQVFSNCFRDNNLPGAYNGNATASDQGFSNGVLSGNKLFNHDEGGFTFHLFPADDVTVQGNISRENNSLVEVRGGGTNVNIAGNIDTMAGIRTILLDGAVTNSTVKGNISNDSSEFGIHLRNNLGTSNTNLLIQGNIVSRARGNAFQVELDAMDNSMVKGNIGKSVGGGPVDPLCAPGTCGLLLRGGNNGNTFQGNIFIGTTWGCRVFGLGNTWSGNIGKPKNTPGTCFP